MEVIVATFLATRKRQEVDPHARSQRNAKWVTKHLSLDFDEVHI